VKTDFQQTSFVGGEIAPALFGRSDIAQYEYACEKLENVLVTPFGSLISCPGTEYIGGTKHSAQSTNNTSRLLPFVFSRDDSFAIEMGHNYFRFFTNGGAVTQ